MAWRRDGGVSGRPRQTNRPIYEDFQPKTEVEEEDGAHIVVLQVPGFLKEQLRITSEHGNNIRVHGQRPLLNNRWSRFNQLLTVPTSCDPSKIQAKFHTGVLTITMPKEEVPKPTLLMSPQEEKPAEKTTQEIINKAIPPKTTDTKETPSSFETLPAAAKDVNDVNAEKIYQKPAAAEKKVEKGQEGIPHTAGSTAEKDEKPRVEKTGGALSPQEETVEPKEQKDHRGETIRKQRETDGEKRTAADNEKHTSEMKSQKGQKEISSKEREEKRKSANEKLGASIEAGKVADKSLNKKRESTEKDEKSKEAGSSENGKKQVVKDMAGTAKQAVTNFGKNLNDDDSQLLINIGAAVMVIVALGLYIYGSSRIRHN